MSKISNKFNLEAVIIELEGNLKNLNFLQKLTYIGSKMQYETKIDLESYFRILKIVNIDIPKNEAHWLFKFLDNDSSGKINLHEIQKLIKLLNKIE